MKRFLLLLLACCATLTPLTAQEANAPKAPKLIVKAETFSDPAFTTPATIFAPGATIYYKLTSMIPAKAEGKTAGVTLNVKATVAGIKIPYSANTVLKMPLKDPVAPNDPVGFDGTTEVHVGEVEVPAEMPNAVFNLKATVRITGVGAVTARNTVTIRR